MACLIRDYILYVCIFLDLIDVQLRAEYRYALAATSFFLRNSMYGFIRSFLYVLRVGNRRLPFFLRQR